MSSSTTKCKHHRQFCAKKLWFWSLLPQIHYKRTYPKSKWGYWAFKNFTNQIYSPSWNKFAANFASTFCHEAITSTHITEEETLNWSPSSFAVGNREYFKVLSEKPHYNEKISDLMWCFHQIQSHSLCCLGNKFFMKIVDILQSWTWACMAMTHHSSSELSTAPA